MDYFINVLISAVNFFPVVVLLLVCAWYFNKYRKFLLRLTLSFSLCVVLFSALTSSNTYKHTTDYDKQNDLYNIQVKQQITNAEIVDKTLKPKLSEKEREEKFNELLEYKQGENK